MPRALVPLSALALLALLLAPPAPAAEMKASAPEKMLPPGQSEKMRACNEKAMQQKIPMEEKAAFVKKCMAEMK